MDSTASYTVAGIPELLNHIFAELDQQSLLQLTLVSAVFHHISIGHLWSRSPWSLGRLLALLPEGIVDLQDPGSIQCVLIRTPQDSEWNRFRHYSVHVTSLTISTREYPTSLVIFLAHQSRSFFPRLRTLTVGMEFLEYGSTEWMDLAGPTLRRLEVSGTVSFHKIIQRHDADIVNYFFQHLIAETPNLAQLQINNFPHQFITLSAAVIDTFCLALHSLPHLQKFYWESYSTLPEPILAAIASHPSIADLSLTPLDGWLLTDRGFPYFPSLKVVRLVCSWRAGDALAAAISNPHLLSTLEMDFEDKEEDHPNMQHHSLQSLFHLFQLSVNLTSIELHFGQHSISWSQLRSLLNCRLLLRLIITTPRAISGLDDEAVKDLASALTNLEVLQLESKSRVPQPLEVTLCGLIPFAQLTPRLLHLNIEITTRTLNEDWVDELIQHQPITACPFRTLLLGSSNINVDLYDTPTFLGPRRTAGVITTLWPRLPSTGLVYGWEVIAVDVPILRPAWIEVQRHMEQRERDGRPISFLYH